LALQQYRILQPDLEPNLAAENVTRLDTDDTTAMLKALGQDGISYAIASQLTNQDKARPLKLVITQTVLPDDALYPYVQARGYAYRQDPGDAAQAFLGFAATKPGQVAVAAAKLEAAKAIAAGKQITLPPVTPVPVSPVGIVPDAPVELPGSPELWRDPRLKFLGILPLIGLGLLVRWLMQRRAVSPAAGIENVKVTGSDQAVSEAETPAVLTPKSTEVESEWDDDWSESGEATANNSATQSKVEAPANAPEMISSTAVSEDASISEIEAEVEQEIEQEFEQPDQSDMASEPVSEAEATPEAAPEAVTPEAVTPEVITPEVITPEIVNQRDVSGTDETPVQIAAELELSTTAETIGSNLSGAMLPDLDIAALAEQLERQAAGDRAEEDTEMYTEIADPEITGEVPSDLTTELQPESVQSGVQSDVQNDVQSDIDNGATNDSVVEIDSGADTDTVSFEENIEISPAVTFQRRFLDYLDGQGKPLPTATPLEIYTALAELVCTDLLSLNTPETNLDRASSPFRLVGEIAAEYLPGPHLENGLINLGWLDHVRSAMQELGLDWAELLTQEEEPGLGRGGLGRLMVCYLDSLATAKIPAIGYGIRYEYGIFDQEIQNGWQVEVTDTWLRNGNPWERERPELTVTVPFAGATAAYIDDQGRYRVRWLPQTTVSGVAYDTPIPGYQTETVNLLRLWRAEQDDLSKVLYPVDLEPQGKALRLKQQFFLVSCALQDALRLHLAAGGQPDGLAARFALQINDTDPTLAVAELMRLLVDDYGLDWERAWEVTQQTLAYTNHSLMPETLDDLWSVGLFAELLPRHLEIIYEINYRLLEVVKAQYPNDGLRLNRVSLIDERGERYVRLNALACVGCHAVNGVSELHTDLLKHTVLRDFYELYPDKFSSQTNGVTPRRFLLQGQPELSGLISRKLGQGWITNLDQLAGLKFYASDPNFGREWLRIKQAAKQRLAAQIWHQTGIEVNPNSLFDVQAMVIHEYKRQHLNLLHILTLYNRIQANPNLDITPRTFIFAGKAAPDYFTAKLMIKLIHTMAAVINPDPKVRGRLKLVFLPDFNIKSAQAIYPAADLAEHLSLAGTEAADTGNMIFALNGALMIGSPDGTNLEIREAVGAENFFEFGLTVSEVARMRAQGYQPMAIYHSNPELKAALDLLNGGLAGGDSELFKPLINLLLYYDQYMLLADYGAYVACQEQVSQAYRDIERWTRMSILSSAGMGKFSSDRAVQAYCREIWQITPAYLNTGQESGQEDAIKK
jgi:glycogen phosphorylase